MKTRDRAAAPHGGTGPDAATRRAVYRRDQWKCACCGTSVMGLPHSACRRAQHPAGADNTMPNLITVLGLGHDPLDPNDHHARIAARRNPDDEVRGLALRSWQDPAQEPVMISTAAGPRRVWLLPDGTRTTRQPPEAAS